MVTPPSSDRLCPACGANLRVGDRFCSNCGWLASGASPAVAATPGAIAAADIWASVRIRLEEATRGRYEIVRQIGAGGMAAVFLARHGSLHRDVAIKVMAPGLLTSAGMIERFLAEARTIAQFRCQNIVQVFEVEKAAGDLYFFVMEYIRGSSLDQVLRVSERLPLDLARVILFEIGQGLAYAHRRGVIHRDIKPSNIMLDSEGLSILTDFGIAKQSEGEGMTQSGARVGTPAYMSPEQCNGLQLAWTSDQYSLGVVAYEMLAGRPPFRGVGFEVQAAHVSQPVPPITDAWSDCPPKVARAVERMLAKAPAQRWPSMQEALQALGCKPLADGDPIRSRLALLAEEAGEPRHPAGTREPSSRGKTSGVERIRLQSLPGILHPGDSAQLVALPLGASDEVLSDRVVVWSSSDSAVVSVDGDGKLSAKAPGRTRIVARCETKSVVTEVDVAGPEVANVAIDPIPALVEGDVAQLVVHATDYRGVDLAPSIRWTSSDERVARVSDQGLMVTGVAGTAVLTAQADAASASCTVTVRAARAATIAPDGTPASPGGGATATAHWTSTFVLVASMIGSIVLAVPMIRASGLLSADSTEPGMGPGMGASEAAGGEDGRDRPSPGDSGSNPPPQSVTRPSVRNPVVAPTSAAAAAAIVVVRIILDSPQPQQRVAVGDSILLQARAVLASGSVGTAAIEWSVIEGTAAELHGSSVLVGRATGRVTVRAAIANPRTEATQVVEVVAPTIGAISVVGSPDSLPRGRRVTLGLRATDVRGRATAVPAPITWRSSNPSVATVSAVGEVEAQSAGTTLITAAAGGRTTEALVRVPAPTPEVKAPTRDSVVAPPPPPELNPEVTFRAAILRHAALLRQADISGVRVDYPVETASDRANLAKLTRLMTTREYRTQVDAEPTFIGAPMIAGSQATWSYSIRFRWRNSFGANLSELVTFETRFERADRVWRMTGARVVGTPKIG